MANRVGREGASDAGSCRERLGRSRGGTGEREPRVARWLGVTLLALGLAIASAGCDDEGRADAQAEEAKPAAPVVTDAHRALARDEFTSVCATCHGKQGFGDGPASKTLFPKPRNFHDTSWQASVSDEQIERTILYGGAAVGKSPAMPAQTDMASRREVLAALREYIRGLGDGAEPPQAQAVTRTGTETRDPTPTPTQAQ